MTAQAQKRLALAQQIVYHGSMRVVANGAILHDRGVLEEERSLILGMALKADIVAVCFFQVVIFRTVVVMATAAAHLFFLHRMMGREQVLRAFVLMAGKTDVGITEMKHFGGSNLMGFMALVAPDTVDGMPVGAPVHHRIAAMALQTDLRTLHRSEAGKANNIAGAAFCLHVAASRTVACLTPTLYAAKFR